MSVGSNIPTQSGKGIFVDENQFRDVVRSVNKFRNIRFDPSQFNVNTAGGYAVSLRPSPTVTQAGKGSHGHFEVGIGLGRASRSSSSSSVSSDDSAERRSCKIHAGTWYENHDNLYYTIEMTVKGGGQSGSYADMQELPLTAGDNWVYLRLSRGTDGTPFQLNAHITQTFPIPVSSETEQNFTIAKVHADFTNGDTVEQYWLGDIQTYWAEIDGVMDAPKQYSLDKTTGTPVAAQRTQIYHFDHPDLINITKPKDLEDRSILIRDASDNQMPNVKYANLSNVVNNAVAGAEVHFRVEYKQNHYQAASSSSSTDLSDKAIVHGGSWIRHLGKEQFTLPASWGEHYTDTTEVDIPVDGYLYLYLDDIVAPTALNVGFQPSPFYPTTWDKDYTKRIIAYVDVTAGTVEQYSSGDIIERLDIPHANFGTYATEVPGGVITSVTVPGGSWVEEWDDITYSTSVGDTNLSVSAGDLVWLELTRSFLVPTSLAVNSGATPPPITENLDVLVIAGVSNDVVTQHHVGNVRTLYKQDDALADSPVGYSLDKSTLNNRDQLYRFSTSARASDPGTNTGGTLGAQPVVGIDNGGYPTVTYRNTDVIPIDIGIGSNSAGSAASMSRSDHYHHVAAADYATTAGSAGTATYATTAGCAGTICGTTFDGSHAKLTDVVGNTVGDDHNLTPSRYAYVGNSGDYSRNQMTTGLGDASGLASVGVAGRVLSDGTVTTLDWKNRQLNNSSAALTLDWQAQHLVEPSGITVLSWADNKCYNRSSVNTLDWNYCALTDNSNQTSINWDARLLYDNVAKSSLDYKNRYLLDLNGNYSMLWGDPAILTVDGTKQLQVHNVTDANGSGGGALRVKGGIDCDNHINSLGGYNVATHVGVDLANVFNKGIFTNDAGLTLQTLYFYDPTTGGTIARQVLAV